MLDLEPNRDNRLAIEHVREAEGDVLGIDLPYQDPIEWGARVQGDLVMWPNDREFGGQSNYFEFRRLRLSAAGHGYGVFDYRLEFDIGSGTRENDTMLNGVEIADVYVSARDVPLFGEIRMGYVKKPFGLENLASSSHVTFMERGLPAELSSLRELGIAAFNYTSLENTTFAAGVFLHDFLDTEYAVVDDSQGFNFVGRLTHLPYYDQWSEGRYLVHTGIAYAFTQPRRQTHPFLPALPFYPVEFDARPEINRGSNLVTTGDLNTRQVHTANAEAAIVWGPVSAQAEATMVRVKEVDLGTVDLYGTYVMASYFLTGENRGYDREKAAFDRVTPYENFWIVDTCRGPQAGWGAWEVAARWSYLDFSDIAGQQLNDLTVGVNWYWNPHSRMMLNWIHPFAHRSPNGLGIDSQGDILAMRLEVEF